VAQRLARSLSRYTPRHLADKILTSRSALEGERKQVTVLFADVAGFTALSTRVDPEELHAIMDGCFRELLEAVHRYEGTVNQFTGDGAMALFGAPIAHEDHAVRAVAAALAIQRACKQYGEKLRADRGVDFAVRIGLNTGPVVVGRIGDDLRMDYTAQGETVNLAARLQQAAAPGGILLSEATHRLVRSDFVTAEHGALSLKGLDRPTLAFAVSGARSRRGRFDRALERGLTPLVGRAREFRFLQDCLERVREGRGQVISVVGEAGIGKSRLVHELKRRLGDLPVMYLEAHCLPHGTSLPYQAIIQLLQGSFGLEEGEPEGAQVQKVEVGIRRLDATLEWTIPYLKHLLALPAGELEAQGLDQAQRKRRMIEAVKALTLGSAQRRPLFLLIEDLQWVDPNSEECIGAVVDGLASSPVFLVSTYRPDYTAPWEPRSFHQRLSLEPLAGEEAAHMVEALLGVPALTPSVRDLVIGRAEGNPFFIEELGRYLRERGMPQRPAAAAEPAWGEVPETIHDLLTARIDRLPDSLKHTLQLASVLGREFSLALLEAIALATLDLKSDLGDLVRRELLHERLFPEARYCFAHPLIQQVAYQGLLLKSRADLHARAAEALERLYADRLDEVVSDLTEHYARSPDRAKAVHYMVRAGDRATSLFAYEQAKALYERALELSRRPGDATDQPSRILERLGDTAFAHGDLIQALGYWTEALAPVLERCDRRRAAALHRKMAGGRWAAGERDEALAHLEQALVSLENDVDNLEAARLFQEFGRIYFHLGEHDRATQWAQRALDLGARLGAPDVVSHASNTLGVALARAGEIEHGAEYVSRSLETALAHQLGTVACRAYTNLAVMYTTLDHDRSVQYCRDGLTLAQKIGDQLQQSWLYCTLAGGHCTLSGDYGEGVKAAEAAIELDRRLGQRNHLPIPLIILAQIYQCRGEYDRSAHYYREALAVAEAVGEPQHLFPCYDGLATLAVERGDEAEAEDWLAKSRQVQETTGWSSDAFVVLPFLC
jgi:adenylate cyclase